MENICFIALGSNRESSQYLKEAQRRLTETFPDIRFSRILKTQPVNFCNSNLFFNQTAVFHTDLEEESVTKLLKTIEKEMGRLPEDKQHGIVLIDLDLLIFNKSVKKAEDLSRTYIKEGLKELHPDIIFAE